MDMFKLRGAIQKYAWGDATFIPSLLGKQSTGTPQAELWMGVHPNGMNYLVSSGLSLAEYIEQHADVVLGEKDSHRFAGRFPFLLKVLSIREPLSLQVHPDTAQARAGYTRQDKSHEKGGNYADPYQKDEVLLALDEVTALAGFRSLREIVAGFKEIVGDEFDALGPCDDVKQLFSALLYLSEPETKKFISFLKAAVSGEDEVNSPFLSQKEIARRLLALYPDDIMAFAPYFLRVVHLRPGAALHVKPGVLHSYVCGHAVEIMSSSDNVLRGGLTRKHVDTEELLKVVKFEGSEGEFPQMKRLNEHTFKVDVQSGEFSLISIEAGETDFVGRDSVEITLILEGEGVYRYTEKELRFTQGDIILIPASVKEYRMVLDGKAVTASAGEGELS